MVVHGDYVYIFGGYMTNVGDLNKAERMKIGEWKWSSLPNMKEARFDFGVYPAETKIYLIGGANNTSIEYFDIATNNFYLLSSIQVPKGGTVCGLIGDHIYAVGKQELKVFTKDLQLIRSEHLNNSYPQCFSDVIIKESSFIYFNSESSNVYSFDSSSRRIRHLRSF